MQIGHPNSHNIQLVELGPRLPWLGNADGTKGTRCFSLLPHHRSWGSGRWMCTGTANSRHNPPTIQRYIPNNVQRHDSISSEDGVMGGSLDWFLLSVYFELLFDVGDDTEEQLARGIEVGGRRTRMVILPNLDGKWAFVSVVPVKRFHFITAAEL
jgi:hypothetical protein